MKGLLDDGFTVEFATRDQPFHHGIPYMSESVTFLLGKPVYLEEHSNSMLGGSRHIGSAYENHLTPPRPPPTQ